MSSHHDWSEETRIVHDKYIAQIDEIGDGFMAMHFAQAHCVWEDSNLDDCTIGACLVEERERFPNITDQEYELVAQSLEELLTIPETIRFRPAPTGEAEKE